MAIGSRHFVFTQWWSEGAFLKINKMINKVISQCDVTHFWKYLTKITVAIKSVINIDIFPLCSPKRVKIYWSVPTFPIHNKPLWFSFIIAVAFHSGGYSLQEIFKVQPSFSVALWHKQLEFQRLAFSPNWVYSWCHNITSDDTLRLGFLQSMENVLGCQLLCARNQDSS